VVAAKSLVAAPLLALVLAASALADQPTVRITKADQKRAEAGLLRLGDFGTGWQGGMTAASKLSAPQCPGFNPKESDLVVTGHADARFVLTGQGVTFGQDVQVLRSEAAVRTDFARTIRPELARCLAYQLRKAPNVTHVQVEAIRFPRVGAVSAAYRATLIVKEGGRTIKLYDDYVFFGVGRYEFALNVVAPVAAGDQLVNFESAMARILIKRTAKQPCC
jgi:hypothetical protein